MGILLDFEQLEKRILGRIAYLGGSREAASIPIDGTF